MISKIIRFSIQNKLIVGFFIAILLAFGGYSLKNLPIDAVPDITNNQVQIITLSPTLATQEVEQFVTFPIEQAIANVPNTEEIRSISRFGLSVITVVFKEEVDIYFARQLLQEKLKLAKQQAQRVVMMRSEDEGFTAATTGPYAWSTYSAASKSEDGIRYRVPEAISDLWYGSEYVAGGLVNLTDVIERNLKPVVVKFKGKISNFDSHCAMLWAYVYSGSDECEIAQTFHGNGSAIPREDILELMDVSYAPNLR